MKTRTVLGSLLVAIALLAVAPAAALAAAGDADADAKCLKCHSKPLKKKLEDGEVLSLQVAADPFSTSVHRVIGCTGCHRDVSKGKHPSRKPISSQRDYSLERNDTCRQCHAAKYTAYKGSVHASLVAAGNAKAPVCSDCHSAHAIQRQAVYEPVSGEPCSSCHEAIYEAYAQSVHGLARANGNVIREEHIKAPICADCHRAHDVTAVAASNYLKNTCLDCHDGAAAKHEKWLPNAAMHMSAVACAACHSPTADRRVDLQLYDNLKQVPLAQSDENGAYKERLDEIDAAGDGRGSAPPGPTQPGSPLMRNLPPGRRGWIRERHGFDQHARRPQTAVRSRQESIELGRFGRLGRRILCPGRYPNPASGRLVGARTGGRTGGPDRTHCPWQVP